MDSVFAQTYPYIEYIVIDGASKDGTIDLLEKQTASITKNEQSIKKFYWKSEKDAGLYDAMNKGIVQATGDFICFLNAGDQLFSENTIKQLAAQIDGQTDIIYGETMLVDENRIAKGTMSALSTRKLPANLTAKSMRFGMVVVHQSFYVKRSIAPQFDISWKHCADIDWVINCLKNSKKTTNSRLALTNYLMGGMSKKQHQASLKERFFILVNHFGWPQTIMAHGYILIRAALHKILKMGRQAY